LREGMRGNTREYGHEMVTVGEPDVGADSVSVLRDSFKLS
jgi:hypothetical protein